MICSLICREGMLEMSSSSVSVLAVLFFLAPGLFIFPPPQLCGEPWPGSCGDPGYCSAAPSPPSCFTAHAPASKAGSILISPASAEAGSGSTRHLSAGGWAGAGARDLNAVWGGVVMVTAPSEVAAAAGSCRHWRFWMPRLRRSTGGPAGISVSLVKVVSVVVVVARAGAAVTRSPISWSSYSDWKVSSPMSRKVVEWSGTGTEAANCSSCAALWSSPMLEMSGGFSASSGATLYGNSDLRLMLSRIRSGLRSACAASQVWVGESG